MIKNFHTFEIEEINFDAGVNINTLSQRIGMNELLSNVTTMFMSFEIEHLVRKLCLAKKEEHCNLSCQSLSEDY